MNEFFTSGKYAAKGRCGGYSEEQSAVRSQGHVTMN